MIDDTNHLDFYDAHILVNQNPEAPRLPYQVPEDCRILAGSRYVMLRKKFADHPPPKKHTGKGPRVLVTMGGSDPSGATPALIDALQTLTLQDMEVKVAVGPSTSHLDRITAAATGRRIPIEILTNPDMYTLMQWANAALTAGGSTCWELCRFGIPFMVFPVADNQKGIARRLAADVLAVNAGSLKRLSPMDLAGMIRTFLEDKERKESISCLGKDLIDGQGARRIVREMLAGPLRLEKTGESCCGILAPMSHIKRPGEILVARVKGHSELILRIDPFFDGLGLRRQAIEQFLQKSHSNGTFPCDWLFLSSPGENPRPPRKITIVSEKDSWLNAYLPRLIAEILCQGDLIRWHHNVHEIPPSDMAFYLSCGQIVPPKILKTNRHNLVVHGSDLPRGKGWSPISWQILEGNKTISMTLFEAIERVDAGPIYLQKKMAFHGGELLEEIHRKTACYTIDLCTSFIKQAHALVPEARIPNGKESSYPKRGPKDSELDPQMPLAAQFNLLRIVDNERFPAFFTHGGRQYKLAITQMDKVSDE